MSEENVTPDTPKGPPPADYVKDTEEVGIKPGRGMELDREPSRDETNVQEEGTSIKNEEKAPDTQEPKASASAGDKGTEEAGGDAEHSSKIISELGEDRKKIIGKFFESAKKDGATAEELKELLASDPRLERVAKTKFGEDYDRLMDPVSTEEEVDIEKIKKQAKLEAKYEAMKEEDARIRTKQFDLFAQSNSLNSDEAEQVKDHANILESKYGWEKALEMSLLLVNRDKAEAGAETVQQPSGGTITKKPEGKAKVTPELKAYTDRYRPGSTVEQVAEGLQRVEERISTEGKNTVFRLSD